MMLTATVLCSGIINQGIWNRTEVAVKKLQNEEKITPIERVGGSELVMQYVSL
jgi:hypothetical protein